MASFSQVMSLTYNLLPVLLSFYLGSWSDTYGRIPFIAINMMGKVSSQSQKTMPSKLFFLGCPFVSFDRFSCIICSSWVKFVCGGEEGDCISVYFLFRTNLVKKYLNNILSFKVTVYRHIQNYIGSYTSTWLSTNNNIIKTTMQESEGDVWHTHTQ